MSKTLKSALAVLKLVIDIGHNVPFDGGIVGIRSENEFNFEVGSRLIKKCEASGINLKMLKVNLILIIRGLLQKIMKVMISLFPYTIMHVLVDMELKFFVCLSQRQKE